MSVEDRRRDERRATAGTVLTAFALQGMLVISGALAARLLGVSDRGYLALLWVITLIVSQVGTLALPAAITYYVAEREIHPREILRSVRSLIVGQAIGLVAVQAVLLVLLVHGDPARVRIAGAMTLLAIPVLLAYQYGFAVIQGRHMFGAYNILRLVPAVGYSIGVTILFVAHVRSLPIVMAIWIGTAAIAGVGAAIVALRGLPDQAKAADSRPPPKRETVGYGAKALLATYGGSDQLQLDQAAVGLFISPHSLGLYVVAIAFTNLPRFVGQSIGIVAFPSVARASGSGDTKRAIARFLGVGVAATVAVIAVLELLVGRLLPLFFGSQFSPAIGPCRILLVASLFQSVRRVLAESAKGAGRPGLATIAEAVTWILMLPAIATLGSGESLTAVAAIIAVSSAVGVLVLLAGLARAPGRPPQEPDPEQAKADAMVEDGAWSVR